MKSTPILSKTPVFLILALALAMSCKQDPGTPDPVYEKPKETISLEQATAMYSAYQKRYEAMNAAVGKEDSRYGWHSVEFYKNYIGFLEQEAKKVNMKISGIRMYYVAYPQDSVKYGDHNDYQTFIYVPTYYDEKKQAHIAFDPLHVENGVPKPIHEIITIGKGRAFNGTSIYKLTSTAAETTSSVANMGEMCKPNCRD
jgi:hypothetical protein